MNCFILKLLKEYEDFDIYIKHVCINKDTNYDFQIKDEYYAKNVIEAMHYINRNLCNGANLIDYKVSRRYGRIDLYFED